MSNNNDVFIKSTIELPCSAGIFEMNIYRNRNDIDYICFVEGPTDPLFYENIKNTVISKKKKEYIRMLTTDETDSGNNVGKEGVIKNYFNISRKFKDLLYKCIFIIDHDYEGLVSQYYEKEDLNENVFSITPYYAFENFFLTDENLYKIFKHFEIENYYKDFIKFLNQFVDETSNYSRLKSSITIACKKGKYHTYLPSSQTIIPYGKLKGQIMTPYNIFHFNFNNYYPHFYNKNFMELKNEDMWKAIKDSELIRSYYNNETQKFINNRNLVRGHDIYKLLEEYLKQRCGINISQKQLDKKSRYKEITELLNIQMQFVNGLGEIL